MRVFGAGRRQIGTIAVLATALLSSGLSVAAASQPEQNRAVGDRPFDSERVAEARDVTELEGLESPAGQPARRDLETAEVLGDFSNPPLGGDELARSELEKAVELGDGRRAKDKSFDARTSDRVEAETTTDVEVFSNTNGTRTAVLSAGPQRFRNAAGEWVSYDLHLEQADDGSFVAAASNIDVRVPADPKDGIAVATRGKDTVRFGVPSTLAEPGSPRLGQDDLSANGHVAVSDDRGVSAAVTLTTSGFEQQVRVPSRDLLPGGGYDLPVHLPESWSARQGKAGTNRVEFLNAEGALVATFGSGVAWDSTGHSIADAQMADAHITLTSAKPGTAVIRVAVDGRWLDEAAFPVTLDPTWTYTFTTSSVYADTFAQSGLSTPMENAPYVAAGRSTTIGYTGTFLKFQLPTSGSPSVPNALAGIVSAELKLRVYSYTACSAQKWHVKALTESWTPSTMTYATGVPAGELFATAETMMQNPGCTEAWYSFFPRSGTQKQFDGTLAPNGFGVGSVSGTATDSLRVVRSAEYGSNAPQLIVTYEWRPDTPEPVAPTDEAAVTTTRPKLEVTPEVDGDGNPVKYWFRIYTDPDYGNAASGQVINSGWIDDPFWTPPAEYLTDGGTYYWHATATDWNPTTGAPRTMQRPPSERRSFTIDTQHGSVSDGLGPIGVNLVTGNASLSLNGPGGVGLTYNSSDAPATGLTGSYYQDTNGDFAFNDPLVVSRRDSTVSFEWGWSRTPDPSLTEDDFLVRWEGTVTPPVSGNWEFGSPVDDRVRIWVNGTQVLNKWTTSDLSTSTVWGTPISLTGGTEYSIKIEYAEDSVLGIVHLQAKLPSSAYADGLDVPTSWLLPKERVPEMAPAGWWAAIDAGGSPYTSIVALNDTAVVMSGDAAVMTFTRTGTGFIPPEGSEATLSADATGRYVLVEDGMRYVFNSDGTLAVAQSSVDDRAQVPEYTYTTISSGGKTYPRVASIEDPDTARSVAYTWSGVGTCPSASGFTAPPTGMICKAVDWDGATTSVLYDGSGRVARFIADPDPGTADDESITDLGYDTCGRIDELRDPLAAATVAAGFRTDDDTTRWLIGYDPATCTTGDWIWGDQIASVTAPEPTAGADRPQTSWEYGTGQTDTHVAGLTEAHGFARRVTYNDDGQLLTDTDATNLTTTYLYDDQGRLVSRVDPAGLKTTSIYNDRDLLTDEWGPAPATSWTSVSSLGAPMSPQAAATPHTTHGYDENIKSLAVSWFNTNTASPDTSPTATATSRETILATGVGTSNGEIDKTWTSTTKPPGIANIHMASAELTGRITFGAAGTYQLKLSRDQKVQLWIDDEQVITTVSHSDADTPVATFVTTQANENHRIRIQTIADPADTQIRLKLWWDLPTTGTTWVVVPGANLSPDYGLETSTTDPDGRVTAYGYTDAAKNIGPHHGINVTTTRDPGPLNGPNLNLVDTNIYSDPTTGDMTQTGRTLPTGAASLVTYENYGSTETRDNPCTTASDPVSQGGAPKLRTDADPDGSGGTAPITHETVYDAYGRMVAERKNADAWTCTTYDSRNRPVQIDYPAFGAGTARTVTYDWAVGGNPLISSIVDPAGSITTMTDLLRRIVEYEDVWGTLTQINYDQAGRESGSVGPMGILGRTYDDVGRLETLSLGGNIVADVTYNITGRPSGVTYPSGAGTAGNGTSGEFGYDDLGRPNLIKWKQANGTMLTQDELTARTLAGLVLDNTVDGVDPSAANLNYEYDNVGRLTTARTPGGHVYSYGFMASGGCGIATDAGDNTNRSSRTIDGGTPITYCYDHADRTTSSSDSAVGTITYDPHGNTSGIFGETHTYDSLDRHLSTTKGGTTVSYVRDALGRIVDRKVNGATSARYGFSASTDSPSVTLNASGSVLEGLLALPGGALLTTRSSGNIWSYPNAHGDIVASASQSGIKQGVTIGYDPDGAALSGTADNAAANADFGWLGQHQRLEEHEPFIEPVIEMGARQYSARLGRFLEVDPIDGGSCSSYDYVCGNPVNLSDLTGEYPNCDQWWNSWSQYCKTIRDISNWAQEESKRLYGRKVDNGNVNAARHFLLSAMLTYVFGETEAKAILGLNEFVNKGSSCMAKRDRLADRHNNAVGISWGSRYRKRGYLKRSELLYVVQVLLWTGGLDQFGGTYASVDCPGGGGGSW